MRQAFVSTARQEGANIAALCRQYGISRPTGYRWSMIERSCHGMLTPSFRA